MPPAAELVGARSSTEAVSGSPAAAASGAARAPVCRLVMLLGLMAGVAAMLLSERSRFSAYALLPLPGSLAARAAGAADASAAPEGTPGSTVQPVSVVQLAPVLNLVPVEEPPEAPPPPSAQLAPSAGDRGGADDAEAGGKPKKGKKKAAKKQEQHSEKKGYAAPGAVLDEEAEELEEGGFGDEAAAPTDGGENVGVAGQVTIFCFLWTTRRTSDESMLHEVKAELAKCDGHAFFTDQGPPEPGMVQIEVPEQSVTRDHDNWLWHRNFVGLLPSWGYICSSGIGSKFDWSINVELDHWMSAERVRANIKAYLEVLGRGSEAERRAIKGPMMLAWGNVFLFNKALVKVMCDHWGELGQASTHPVARGCPAFMKGRPEWPDHCSQDMVYPSLADILGQHGVHAYGPSGCGQPDRTNSKGEKFPLTCWEAGWGKSDEELVQMVHEIAKVETMASEAEVEAYFKTKSSDKPWKVWYNAKGVPIIHHMSKPAGHRAARELLRGTAVQTPLFPV